MEPDANQIVAWIGDLTGEPGKAEPAARALKHAAELDPAALYPHRRPLFRIARQTGELRVRWNLIVVLGLLALRGAQRQAVVDWLFERLADASPFTRTFALDALVRHAGDDAALRARMRPIAERFAAAGSAAMRARARRLLPLLAATSTHARRAASKAHD